MKKEIFIYLILGFLVIVSSMLFQSTETINNTTIIQNDVVGFSASGNTGSTSSTWGIISFNTEIQDTNNSFDGTTYTIPEDGVYIFATSIVWASVNDGTRYITAFQINGGASKTPTHIVGRGTAGSTNLQGVGGALQRPMNAGDTIRVIGFTETSQSMYTGSAYGTFSAYKIG